MEDPSFRLTGIRIVNVILKYINLGLFIMCLILAFGNRPRKSIFGYMVAFIGFSIIAAYMMAVVFFVDGKVGMLTMCALDCGNLPCGQKHSELCEREE
jgi:hypothetical protein